MTRSPRWPVRAANTRAANTEAIDVQAVDVRSAEMRAIKVPCIRTYPQSMLALCLHAASASMLPLPRYRLHLPQDDLPTVGPGVESISQTEHWCSRYQRFRLCLRSRPQRWYSQTCPYAESRSSAESFPVATWTSPEGVFLEGVSSESAFSRSGSTSPSSLPTALFPLRAGKTQARHRLWFRIRPSPDRISANSSRQPARVSLPPHRVAFPSRAARPAGPSRSRPRTRPRRP